MKRAKLRRKKSITWKNWLWILTNPPSVWKIGFQGAQCSPQGSGPCLSVLLQVSSTRAQCQWVGRLGANTQIPLFWASPHAGSYSSHHSLKSQIVGPNQRCNWWPGVAKMPHCPQKIPHCICTRVRQIIHQPHRQFSRFHQVEDILPMLRLEMLPRAAFEELGGRALDFSSLQNVASAESTHF